MRWDLADSDGQFARRNGAYDGKPIEGLEDTPADISRLEEGLHAATLTNGIAGTDLERDGLLLAGSMLRSLEMGAE